MIFANLLFLLPSRRGAKLFLNSGAAPSLTPTIVQKYLLKSNIIWVILNKKPMFDFPILALFGYFAIVSNRSKLIWNNVSMFLANTLDSLQSTGSHLKDVPQVHTCLDQKRLAGVTTLGPLLIINNIKHHHRTCCVTNLTWRATPADCNHFPKAFFFDLFLLPQGTTTRLPLKSTFYLDLFRQRSHCCLSQQDFSWTKNSVKSIHLLRQTDPVSFSISSL